MKLLDRIKSGLFYMDGGTGSYLQGKGLKPGEFPELWNLHHPEVITELAIAYYEAGSHMVCANTFGALFMKLSRRLFSVRLMQKFVQKAVKVIAISRWILDHLVKCWSLSGICPLKKL